MAWTVVKEGRECKGKGKTVLHIYGNHFIMKGSEGKTDGNKGNDTEVL